MKYHVTGKATLYFQRVETMSKDVKIDTTIEADSPEEAQQEAVEESVINTKVSYDWDFDDVLPNLKAVEIVQTKEEIDKAQRDLAFQQMQKFSKPLFDNLD